MTCSSGWTGLACQAAGAVATQTADGILGQLSHAILSAITWAVALVATWWVAVPSYSSSTASGTLQSWVSPITALVAVAGVLWQALRMIFSRRPEPLLQIVRGLATVALWGAVGIVGSQLLIRASDGFSLWVLGRAIGDVTADGLSKRLVDLVVPTVHVVPAGTIVLVGWVVLLLAFLQALLMYFRAVSLLVLTGMLQLAAAGAMSESTRSWRPRVTGWCLALIAYKPAASLIYALGILLIGKNVDTQPGTFLAGITLLVLALLALPVLIRLFSWTTGGLQSSGGSLGLLATVGAGGLHGAASLRGVGGGRTLAEHVRYLESSLDPRSTGSTDSSADPTRDQPPTFHQSGAAGETPAAPSPAAGASSVTPGARGAADGAASGTTLGASSASPGGGAAAGGAASVAMAGAATAGVGAGIAAATSAAAAARRAADSAAHNVADPPTPEA